MIFDAPTILSAIALPNFAANGSIGAAASTVDLVSHLTVNQTTAGITLSLPNPTDTVLARVIFICNIGTVALTINGASLAAGNYIEFFWDGAAWRSAIYFDDYGYISSECYQTPGVYVLAKPARATRCLVELQGGGGGGGGAAATGATQCSVGSGGGGGAYLHSAFIVPAIPNPTITVGSGGLGIPGANGLPGTFSRFTDGVTTLTANGGNGGAAGAASAVAMRTTHTAGGTTTGGLINCNGEVGQIGWITIPGSDIALAGAGGGSHFGWTTWRRWIVGGSNGQDGAGPGNAGSGAFNTRNVATPRTGGNGVNGLVIIHWYAQ